MCYRLLVLCPVWALRRNAPLIRFLMLALYILFACLYYMLSHLLAGTQHSLVLFMKTRIGVMSCGTAGPLGSVPGMWNHLQGDQVN